MILYKNLFHDNPKANKSLFDLIYILKVDYKIVFAHQTRTELVKQPSTFGHSTCPKTEQVHSRLPPLFKRVHASDCSKGCMLVTVQKGAC